MPVVAPGLKERSSSGLYVGTGSHSPLSVGHKTAEIILPDRLFIDISGLEAAS